MATPRSQLARSGPFPTVITVDGPAASGKTTLARSLAAFLDLPFFDTSTVLPAIASLVLERGGDPTDTRQAAAVARRLSPTDVENIAPLPQGALMAAEALAQDETVRKDMRRFLRQYRRLPGVVIEGQDTGHTLFPDATAKICLTAPDNVRVHRLIKRAIAAGTSTDINTVYRDMMALDSMRLTKATSSRPQADDVIAIDTDQHDQMTCFALGLRGAWPHLPETVKSKRRTAGALALTVGTMASNTFDFMAKYPFAEAAKEARIALEAELDALPIDLPIRD